MGARSLSTQRAGVEIAGNNIANVNTPNAARQRVNILQDIQVPLGLGVQGTGAFVQNIEALRAAHLDAMVVRQESLNGLYERRDFSISLLQDALGESLANSETAASEGISSSTGLQNDLNKFFDAWQELAADPSNLIKRQEVLSRASSLANDIQSVYNRVLDVKSGLFDQATTMTQTINSLSTQIASLNQEIAQTEVNTQSTANELRDRRQELVEQLAKLANITVTNNASNSKMIDIELTSNAAVDLVIGTTGGGTGSSFALSVSAAYNRTTNSTLQIDATSAVAADITPLPALQPSEGELGALLLSANNDIGATHTPPGAAPVSSDPLVNKLNYLADRIINLVNPIFDAGEDLAGVSGIANFFTGTNALTIALNTTVDPSEVAAAAAGAGVLDGTQAQSIANLRDNASISPVLRQAVADVGVIAGTAKQNIKSQTLLMEQIEGQREAVSGISVDEEMTNLVLYQRAYEASARFIGVIGEMLSTVIGIAR